MALNPETGVEEAAAKAIDAGVDLVLCMSVHPGYSGQAFIPESIERIQKLRELLPDAVHVQVDGGVGHDNIRGLHEAGARLFVAATTIFSSEDVAGAYAGLVQELA
jgi:ribulose-phosphate 3-epimerase